MVLRKKGSPPKAAEEGYPGYYVQEGFKNLLCRFLTTVWGQNIYHVPTEPQQM